KHLSPSIAQNPLTGDAWLFWQGQAYLSGGGGRINQENRVFYTDVTGGNIHEKTPDVFSFTPDFSMIKYSPRGLAYTDPRFVTAAPDKQKKWLWIFYYGGDAGRWSIFYNVWDGPPEKHPDDAADGVTFWSRDARLPTPESLASVSEPMATYWRNDGSDHYLNVVYTGVSGEGQNSDIYMSRYRVNVDGNPKAPIPVPFPKRQDEVLTRDNKRGLYASRDIWWVKPTQVPATWPVIVVQLPNPDGSLQPPIFATDPAMRTMEEDRATGLLIFTHTGADAKQLSLGQVIVDPGAGTVRFTKLLNSYDTTNTHAKVTASYTPRALRWSSNSRSDTSAFVLVDKTPNTAVTMGPTTLTKNDPHPVDRLWLFWRKPANVGKATTIYYRTFREGVQLSK
ncbi:MAG: hypothetical protein Q7R41_11625, partial [Phycisphaerales bacterium]|nr:hypothetical protein [Phycisphaerales bacterium]